MVSAVSALANSAKRNMGTRRMMNDLINADRRGTHIFVKSSNLMFVSAEYVSSKGIALKTATG